MLSNQNSHAIAECILYQVFSRSLTAISIIRKDLLWHSPTPSFLPQNFLCHVFFLFMFLLVCLGCFFFFNIKLLSLHFVSFWFGFFFGEMSMQHKMLCFYLELKV